MGKGNNAVQGARRADAAYTKKNITNVFSTGGVIMQERHKLVALCVAASFVSYIDRVNISVAALAMQEHYGWSETVKGIVLSSFFVGYLLFMVPSGWAANRFGGKRVLGLAVLWWSIFTMLTPLAAGVSFALLIAARIAMGAGEAAMFPAVYNLYSRWVPAAERSRAVALMIGGVPLGTLFALMSSGVLVSHLGWPSVFYLFGLIGLAWCLLWNRYSYDYPDDNPRLTPAERSLLPEVAPRSAKDRPPVPWRQLLTSAPVWALIINHLCSNWILYMLLAWLPSYFRKGLGLSIQSAGLYAAAPWLAMLVCGVASGWLADRWIRGGTDATFVRKFMQIAGLLGAAFFMWQARAVTSPDTALALMCGALGALAMTWGGFVSNHLDIAPRYADVLMGITNTAGTLPGVIGVTVTGALVDASGTYTSAFVLAACVNIFGALVWLLFATARKVVD